MRLCLARVVTPRLTRAMFRPPYFRPYGAQAFTRAVSASERTRVPRFWRMYLALWLISRWRLPTTPCLSLPVAVSLKRFLTPLLVLSLGIFVSLLHRWGATLSNRHGMPSGRAIGFPMIWKARAYRLDDARWQPTRAVPTHRGGGNGRCRRWSAVRSAYASPKRFLPA